MDDIIPGAVAAIFILGVIWALGGCEEDPEPVYTVENINGELVEKACPTYTFIVTFNDNTVECFEGYDYNAYDEYFRIDVTENSQKYISVFNFKHLEKIYREECKK